MIVANPVVAKGPALNDNFRMLPVPATAAVTPFGKPETVNVTVPVKPFKSVILMRLLAVEF